jgi:hypothetical protein
MAPTDIWSGTGFYWSDDDWSGDDPPTSSDDVEIANGASTIEPGGAVISGVTVNSLTLDPSANLSVLADGLSVTNAFTNSGGVAVDDSTVTVGGNFDNHSSFSIDPGGGGDYDYANEVTYPTGGSTITIDGTFINEFNAILQVGGGNGDATANTFVSVNAISNSGQIIVKGTASGYSTTLEIASAAGFGTAGEVSGEDVELIGNAVIRFDGDGPLTKIDSSTQLILQSGSEIDDKDGVGSNSALTTLTDVEGTLTLDDETLTTTTDLFIHSYQDGGNVGTGVLNVDLGAFYSGGSRLTIGGTLINHYAVQIGSGTLSSATKVTATGIDNSSLGQLSIHGGSFAAFSGSNNSLVAPAYATLELASQAGFGTEGILTGTVSMDGRPCWSLTAAAASTRSRPARLFISTGPTLSSPIPATTPKTVRSPGSTITPARSISTTSR